MTEEEILRQKYIVLQKKMYQIKKKLKKSLNEYDELFSLIKESILINEEVDEYEALEKINQKLNFINDNLINEVIPRINNKI